jgi:putative superfamily III holin-X
MATAASTGPHLDGSIRSLLGDVLDNVRSLLRLELALARGEVRRAVLSLRRGALLLAVGTLLGTLGLFSLMAALVGALSTVWPFWLAATVVGIVFAALGGAMGRLALSGLKFGDVRTSATFETLEETKAWLKSRA